MFVMCDPELTKYQKQNGNEGKIFVLHLLQFNAIYLHNAWENKSIFPKHFLTCKMWLNSHFIEHVLSFFLTKSDY